MCLSTHYDIYYQGWKNVFCFLTDPQLRYSAIPPKILNQSQFSSFGNFISLTKPRFSPKSIWKDSSSQEPFFMPTIFHCQCVRSDCLPPLWKVNPHFHHTVYLTLEITLAGWHFVFMEKCVTCTHCHVTRKQGHCIKIYLPFPSPLPLEKSLPVHCLHRFAMSRRPST